MADKARLERVLGKFTLKELPKIAKKQLGLKAVPKAESKKELVALLVAKCLESELTPSDLLALELYRKPIITAVSREGLSVGKGCQ